MANTSCLGVSGRVPSIQTQPASFEVISVALVAEGGNIVEIKANIRNNGGLEGRYNAVVLINDKEMDTKAVSVAPGTTETLSFECGIDKGKGNIIKLDRFVIPVDQLIALPFSDPQTYILGGDSMFNEFTPPVNIINLRSLDLNPHIPDTETITRNFVWLFDGITWKWEMRIPKYLSEYYGGLKRLSKSDYLNYINDAEDDVYISKILSEMIRTAEEKGYSVFKTVQFIAAFVQYIPHTSDIETTGYRNYPRYPIQTLADFGGDCEDTVILLATLLNMMHQDFIIVSYPDHYGIGILGDENTYGTYWEYNGKRYFYLETSEWGWALGELPAYFKDKPAVIYSLE